MSRRFNPPPGWPPAPEGFEPPPGWQPDPSWPPPPPGWQFWIEDAPFGFAEPPPATPFEFAGPPPAPRRRAGKAVALVVGAVAAVAIGGTLAANVGRHDTAAPLIIPDATPTPARTALPTPPAGVAPTDVPTVTSSTTSSSPTPQPSVTEVGDLPSAAIGDCWRRKGVNGYEKVGCTRAHVAQVYGVATASRPGAYKRAKKPVQTARQQAQIVCRRAEGTTQLSSRGEKSDVGVSFIYPQDSTLSDPTSSTDDLQIVCLLKLEKGTTTSALIER
jgi:hypothetical protein